MNYWCVDLLIRRGRHDAGRSRMLSDLLLSTWDEHAWHISIYLKKKDLTSKACNDDDITAGEHLGNTIL
eukprot:scaffold4927_cov139-Amphora_coffeaeformis.AAC.15